MPHPKTNPNSISETALTGLLRRGIDSDVLKARLEWSESEAIARYVRPLVGKLGIKPNVLPTAQVSGRWSTTNPPRLTWPAHDPEQCSECRVGGRTADSTEWCPRDVRAIAEPLPGTWWLKGDADAIEARLAAAYCHDQEDLDAFALGHDLHAVTMCRMFRLPLPPNFGKKVINSGAECAAWRAEVRWGGESDRRRHAAKTFRYAWQYAVNEFGVLQAKSLQILGLTKDEILDYARKYRTGKPGFFAARQAYMDRCAAQRESRTFLGRLRRLWGDRDTRRKEGWNHMVQGAVSDIVNIVVRAWYNHPEFERRVEFISNGYDALEMAHPEEHDPEWVLPRVKNVVEREWDVLGVKVFIPWSWKVVRRIQ